MLSWIGWTLILGLAGWTFGFLFVMALMRMAGDDRAARHEEKVANPFSGIPITQVGRG